ncbi:response regulator transcription factor [Mycolicibacterium sp. P9-64]|uniref:response regulator transcription factor n=1 Tax=Mycolicibacterium sp. P9-64 TaxID=2024612 RepID=UPI0024134F44|nr:response regulator transcription factor [Mycolicibacterium sp. P9-64]
MACIPPSMLEMRTLHGHPERSQSKVLIVDAECVVAEMLSMALHAEGIVAMTAYDSSSALSAMRSFRPDLVVLDTRLPDADGMVLLERLSADRPGLLTLRLTRDGTGGEGDRIVDTAVDDWLIKPFSIEEALLRIRRVLRSNGINDEWTRSTVRIGDLVVDEDSRTVSRGGERIALTPTEFRFLSFLARNAGRVVTPGEIFGRVWKYDAPGKPAQVPLYVLYLRRRIDLGRDPMIHTVRRAGYVLRPSLPAASGPHD